MPGVIKAIKSAKIVTLPLLSCRVTYFLILHSEVHGKMQHPHFFIAYPSSSNPIEY